MAVSIHNQPSTVAQVAISDVFDSRRRVRALARLDKLDHLCRLGKLDNAALEAGRTVERAFEAMSHVGAGNQWWDGDRISSATQAEIMVVAGAQRAAEVNKYLTWLVSHLGRMDCKILWYVLGERFSFDQVAAGFGKPDRRGRRYVLDRFCDSLTALAEVKAAKGRALR